MKYVYIAPLIPMLCVVCVYCRDARNMARDVHDAMLRILQEQGGMDPAAATAFIKNMQKRNRYQLDVWS